MTNWSDPATTAKLSAHGVTLQEAAKAWLEEHHPEFLASEAHAIPGAALQALANAEAQRVQGTKNAGGAWANALAHQVAILCMQQSGTISDAFEDFEALVAAKVDQLLADGAANKMVGGSLPTAGRA